ncbi:Translation factor guf1 mitochondrial [Quaeritorhiza haematococci]|nr:Translation factor guf1 mitochondrial [Quaeritorhiza haematococci]
MTGTIKKDKQNKQVLDKLKVERERGITVKAQSASMLYTHNGEEYLLNLIDTPGHVDFSYEVSRSLAACQGTLLLVDACQGIQAQTVANFYLAYAEGLEIVPVINKFVATKIDLPAADPDKVARQLQTAFEIDSISDSASSASIIQISAKTGVNTAAILPSIIERIPPPTADLTAPFRALLFDSWYDQYRGVICLVAVGDGKIVKGDWIMSTHTKNSYEISELGIMYPEPTPTASLQAGQVGYLILGMKSVRDAHIGDTFCHFQSVNNTKGGTSNTTTLPQIKVYPGFQPAKSMVFSGLYPIDASDYTKLQEALERLTLNDASVTVERESSVALGQGFRLGFLGTLHMDVFRQRLEEEYEATVINTAPTVPYQIRYHAQLQTGVAGANKKKTSGGELTKMTVFADPVTGKKIKTIRNPADFPDLDEMSKIDAFLEPIVLGTMIFPKEYLGSMMELCGDRRGELQEYIFLDETRVMLKYKMPLAEILIDFHDHLKSRTSGYASFDYEEVGYQEADLVKINFLLNGKPIDALATIVHKSRGDQTAKDGVKKLKSVMSRELFDIVIQASIGNRVVARENIRALRKDVTAKCYGGDITRKMKLLEKQKQGKKKLKKMVGGISLPQEAFLSLMGGSGNASSASANNIDATKNRRAAR